MANNGSTWPSWKIITWIVLVLSGIWVRKETFSSSNMLWRIRDFPAFPLLCLIMILLHSSGTNKDLQFFKKVRSYAYLLVKCCHNNKTCLRQWVWPAGRGRWQIFVRHFTKRLWKQNQELVGNLEYCNLQVPRLNSYGTNLSEALSLKMCPNRKFGANTG